MYSYGVQARNQAFFLSQHHGRHLRQLHRFPTCACTVMCLGAWVVVVVVVVGYLGSGRAGHWRSGLQR